MREDSKGEFLGVINHATIQNNTAFLSTLVSLLSMFWLFWRLTDV